MKLLFILLVIVSLIFSEIEASCSAQALPSGNKNNCGAQNGKIRKFGDSWKSNNCEQCSCSKSGIECCLTYAQPTAFDKANCEAIFNKKKCRYDVVQKKNRKVKCPVFAAVGR